MSELAREFVEQVHERAADHGGHRECWSYTRGEVTLTVGLGPGVGFAVWTDAWITSGGVNDVPVEYEIDEGVTAEFPVGCEHPIEVVVEVLERFVEHRDRSSDVEWAPFSPGPRP